MHAQTLAMTVAPQTTRSIRTLIVDDEQFARQRLQELCRTESDIAVVGECSHGAQALAAIEELRPDLVLLDVQMRGSSGFDVLRSLAGGAAPLIIFVTAYENHALRAFEFDAVDYLLKPFDAARFHAAIARARQRLAAGGTLSRQEIAEVVRGELQRAPQPRPNPARRIVAERDDRLTFINPQDIDSIEADRNYISIRVGRESFRLRCTMQQAQAMLDPECFLRIHRSVIVNSLRIHDMERWFHGEYVITLKNGQRFTSGRAYRQRIQGFLKNGLERSAAVRRE